MIICRWFISLQLFLLCIFICLVGYDPPQSEAQTDSPEQSNQTAQSTKPKRAPRTLEAFQNAIESKQVGTISGRALFKGEPPPPKELRVTLNKKTCGHTYQSEGLLIAEKGGIQNVVVSLLRIPQRAAGGNWRQADPNRPAKMYFYSTCTASSRRYRVSSFK